MLISWEFVPGLWGTAAEIQAR